VTTMGVSCPKALSNAGVWKRKADILGTSVMGEDIAGGPRKVAEPLNEGMLKCR
jgi:hypothetical protein